MSILKLDEQELRAAEWRVRNKRAGIKRKVLRSRRYQCRVYLSVEKNFNAGGGCWFFLNWPVRIESVLTGLEWDSTEAEQAADDWLISLFGGGA